MSKICSIPVMNQTCHSFIFAKFTLKIQALKLRLFCIALLPALILSLGWIVHPFFVSVTDIKYDEKTKLLEIACKMFSNDLEGALKKSTGKKIDLLNEKNKAESEKILFDYIQKRLLVKVNGKAANYTFIGFEKEEDAIWTYMECKSEKPKQLDIDVKLLYEFLKDQINMVHSEVGGVKKSYKVNNPDSSIKFEYK
jgi:hypothetical protein